jgi:hypothetical protein
MKKLNVLLGVAALLASSGAMAGQFGIGMCEYTTSGRTGEVMWGVKAAHRMNDSTYEQMEKYCSSPVNMQQARVALNKQPEMPAAVAQPLPAQGVNIDEATDTYQACVLGATGDGKGYLKLVSSYGGNVTMQQVLRKAHSYGYNVARTYRNCTDYVMGY